MSLTISARKRLPHFTLDVDCSVPCSGIHALVGPSGAGKTTLLRLLCGLETPDSGYIRFGEAAWSDERAGIHLQPWQRPVGMVFQDFELFPHRTLWNNVLFAAADLAWAESLMRALDVWPLRMAKPWQVSGGERQRCAICPGLARRPRLLLLDEPFSALDPVTRSALGAFLRKTADTSDIPMILVTHNLEEALTLSDSILTLVGGRLAAGWLEQRIAEMERDAARNWELFKLKHAERRI